MFITNSEQLACNEPLLRQYFSTGWYNIAEFCDEQDWNAVATFEDNPDRVIINYELFAKQHDMLPAKRRLFGFLAELISDSPINYFEFGVRQGRSLRWACEGLTYDDSRFHGFDTFTGLPEGWVPAWGNRGRLAKPREPGCFAVDQIPRFDDQRVRLWRGLFQETVPAALRSVFAEGASSHSNYTNIINVDGDTYTAALYVLTAIHPHIRPGDFLYFDELYDPLNEFAAFNDYVRSYYLKAKFKLIARAYDGFLFERLS